jgi:nitrous oxide reductase accessory protein NosL
MEKIQTRRVPIMFKTRTVSITLVLLLSLSSLLLAQMNKCAECGMMVDEKSPFSAKIVQKDRTLSFCDIGDMLIHVKTKNIRSENAQVRDFKSGEWIDGAKAWYVSSAKHFTSPMGWNIAAFRNKNEAEKFGAPLDLDNAMKALK